MKRAISTSMFALLFAAANAQISQGSTTYELAKANEWRGTVLTDGLVFQPSINFSTPTGTQLSAWGSFDLDNKGINELRFSVRHNFALLPAAITIGLMNYQRESGIPDTTEIFGRAKLSLPLPLSFEIWKDIDAVDGLYARVGMDGSLPKISLPGSSFGIGWQAWLGYSDENHSAAYYGSTAAGVADLGGRISAEFGVGTIWVSPWFQYTTLVDPGFDSFNGHRTNLTYGVMFRLGS